MRFDPYVGLPFLDRGRSIAGLDCWGLLRLVYRELRGIELPCYGAGYVTSADRAAIAGLIAGELGESISEPWRPIEAGEEITFDGVLMREGRFARHIGLVTEPGRVLHVDSGATSRIESYRAGILQCRVVGFYRFCG